MNLHRDVMMPPSLASMALIVQCCTKYPSFSYCVAIFMLFLIARMLCIRLPFLKNNCYSITLKLHLVVY